MDDLGKIRQILTVILLLMVFTTIFFAKDVVLPIVLAMLLALTLSPLVRGAQRAGIAPPISAFVLIFSLAAGGGAGAYFMSGVVGGWIHDAPQLTSQLRVKLSSVARSVEAVKDATQKVDEITDSTAKNVPKVVVKEPGILSNTISNVANFGTSLAVGMFLALIIMASGDLFYAKLVEAFPRMQDKKRVLRIVYDVERRISRYLLSITFINAGLGVAVALALYALGVPYFYIWGVVAFSFNYLPYLGAVIGAALVGAFAVITFDNLYYAALVPLSYLTLTTIEGQLITPYLLGRRMELNTVSVFLTVIFWAWLWGVPGALMAVPILVVLKVVCDNVEGLSTLGNFLSARNQLPEKIIDQNVK